MMSYARPYRYRHFEKLEEDVSITPCIEGKPMNHLIFRDRQIGDAVGKLLSDLYNDFEIHDDGKLVCVPVNVSRVKLKGLI